MWLNVVALVVLLACIAAGAWSGALATGLRIATIVLAYAAAVLLGPATAPAIGGSLGLGDPLATLASGSVVFAIVYAVLAIAARFARRLGPRENVGRSPRDRFLGGCFGAIRGALIALMVVYLAMVLDALRATGAAPVVPEIGDSVAADVTSGVVKGALESTIDTSDPAARVATHFAARPAVAAAEIQRLIDDPNVARLRSDSRFWSDVEQGHVDSALQRDSFLSLSEDPDLRRKAANLGIVSEDAVADPSLFRASLVQVVEDVAPRLRNLRNDPAVQQMLGDPAVMEMLERGDTIGLLAHPKFRELVSRLSAAPPGP
jgi:uncharacterized membrane protein required for colicin V production